MKRSGDRIGFGKNSPGFTIIEVMAVLVILGIVSALALSRIASTSSYSLASETEILKMHLRYSQFRAISDDVTWTMSFTGNSYTLQRTGGPSYTLPNESSATHTLASDISFSPTPGTVTFDDWGSPGTSDITVTLSSGGENKAFTITRNTGFIP